MAALADAAPAPGTGAARTRDRWAQLRAAVRQTAKSQAGGESLHRQERFQLFAKSEELLDAAAQPSGYVTMRYALGPKGSAAALCVRERRADARVSLAELAAHNECGVDNTGNVRVWPAEQVLLHTVLRAARMGAEGNALTPLPLHGRTLLELGGGMTALAGLGLAAAGVGLRLVTVSDGNPQAVENLRLCVDMNQHLFAAAGSEVVAERVVWSNDDPEDTVGQAFARLPQDCQNMAGGYDLILCSDVLFFEEFHAYLAVALDRLLSRKNGTVLLCQPHRNGSLGRFLTEHVVPQGVFTAVDLGDVYDADIARMAQGYAHESTYVPDVHFPRLVRLTRITHGH